MISVIYFFYVFLQLSTKLVNGFFSKLNNQNQKERNVQNKTFKTYYEM